MLIRILEIVSPIFLVVAIGVAYGRRHRPDMEAANRLNLDVFIPALVFSALAQAEFDLHLYANLAIGAAGIILIPGVIMLPLSRLLSIQAKTIVPPVMFCNAGNMGLPLMTLAFGESALTAALVLFLVGNLLHFGLGAYMLDRRAPIMKILLQPALVAAALGLLFSAAAVSIPRALLLPIEMIGSIAVPLMLFSLGVRVASADLSEWRVGALGAIISPLAGVAAAAIVLSFLELPPLQHGILILMGALPPAVMNFLFAERYHQEPAKVAAIVVLGNLFSVISLPLALAFVLPRYG